MPVHENDIRCRFAFRRINLDSSWTPNDANNHKTVNIEFGSQIEFYRLFCTFMMIGQTELFIAGKIIHVK